jgi:hypothetical protein
VSSDSETPHTREKMVQPPCKIDLQVSTNVFRNLCGCLVSKVGLAESLGLPLALGKDAVLDSLNAAGEASERR